jgi:hypothetical protein
VIDNDEAVGVDELQLRLVQKVIQKRRCVTHASECRRHDQKQRTTAKNCVGLRTAVDSDVPESGEEQQKATEDSEEHRQTRQRPHSRVQTDTEELFTD